MANKDIRIRKKNGSVWDIYYPETKASLVKTNDNGNVEDKIATINSQIRDIINNGGSGGGPDGGIHIPPIETANVRRFLRNDNTWQDVTPINIGALSVNGGTLQGDLTLDASSASAINIPASSIANWQKGLFFKNSTSTEVIGYIKGIGRNSNQMASIDIGIDNDTALSISHLDLRFNGNKVYHEGNKPIPSDIGALSESGTSQATKKLEKPVKINGVNFDGTADISIGLDGGSHEHDNYFLNTGGDITGAININYNNASMYYKNKAMIKMYDTSLADLNSISLIGLGRTLLVAGRGESQVTSNTTASTKDIYICADTNVNLVSNLQSNWSGKNMLTYTYDGKLAGLNAIQNNGTLNIYGSESGITNLKFVDVNKSICFDSNTGSFGIKKGSSWEVNFVNGTMDWGKVPYNNIINRPATFPPSIHNHDDKYCKKGDNVDGFYAGTTAPNNDDGNPNGTIYFRY